MIIDTKSTYKFIDGLALLIACCIAYWLRFDTIILPQKYLIPTFVFIFFGSLSLSVTQHYQNIHDTLHNKIKTAVTGILLTVMSTTMFLYLTKTGQDFSRIWLGLSTVLSLSLIIFYKFAASELIAKSIGKKSIIVVGNNQTAQEVIAKLKANKNNWLFLDKYFDVNYKSLSDITTFIEENRESKGIAISEVWITYDVYSQYRVADLNFIFSNCSVQLVFIPEIPKMFHDSQLIINYIEGIPTVNSGFSDEGRINNTLKLLEDKLIAILVLVLLTPVLLLICLIIKIDSKGPVLYRQLRYGINGREFSILKFRSMKVVEKTDDYKQAVKNDLRITRFGHFLRVTSLDELPQLINVLAGDMSLVGPRPHPNVLNEDLRKRVDNYMLRHKVKPGITGLAQISGYRGEFLSHRDITGRTVKDLYYVQNWSLGLDLMIILKTIVHVTKHSFQSSN